MHIVNISIYFFSKFEALHCVDTRISRLLVKIESFDTKISLSLTII